MSTGDREAEAASRPARKLLLLTNSVAVGGMEEHVRLIAARLDRSLFHVHAVVPDWEPTEGFTAAMRQTADVVTLLSPDRRHGVRRYLLDAVRLNRLARRERFDVAHLHSTNDSGLTLAVLALRAAGLTSIVVTEHLPPARRASWLRRTRRRLLTSRLAAVVCVSEFNRSARERYLGDAGCPVHVIDNGIDVTRFDDLPDEASLAELGASLDIGDSATIVGTAIRLEADKGVDDLIDAFALVAHEHPDTVLLVAGDGKLRPELERRADDLGIRTSVRFVGFQPDPVPYIMLTDVFVLPVPYGSASIGLLEAMAMRRACIITFGDGNEAVRDGLDGLCAPPSDPAGLADAIGRLVADPDERLEFGTEARRVVERSYSAERVATDLARLYQDVAP